VPTNSAAYRRLRRKRTCSRCRRRPARQGKTKCGVCASQLRATDSIGGRRRKYGATTADVHRLIDEQDGKCFCGKCVDPTDALDHEHETKDLRGVLCPPHNAVIGRTDADLFNFADGVARYAGTRRRVLVRRECVKAREACGRTTNKVRSH